VTLRFDDARAERTSGFGVTLPIRSRELSKLMRLACRV